MMYQNQFVDSIPGCNGIGILNNDDWIAFYAGTETLSIQITPSNCAINGIPNNLGIQAGIYADCDPNGGINGDGLASNPLLVICHPCTTDTINLTASNYIIGNLYYLLVDGCTNGICD